MMAYNPEVVTPEDSEIFVYQVSDEPDDRAPANVFNVKGISLEGNGWVFVVSHDDTPIQCFPPWRIITLEGPIPSAGEPSIVVDIDTARQTGLM
jgi:hypothetical protein